MLLAISRVQEAYNVADDRLHSRWICAIIIDTSLDDSIIVSHRPMRHYLIA